LDIYYDEYISYYLEWEDFGNASNLNLNAFPYLESLNLNDSVLFDGLESLTNLKELYCHSEDITNLDLSLLKSLEILDCSGTSIEYLDLSNCSNLKEVNCSNTNLNKLIPSDNFVSKPKLNCNNCQLESKELKELSKYFELENYNYSDIETLQEAIQHGKDVLEKPNPSVDDLLNAIANLSKEIINYNANQNK